jgi:hypothetical protein
MITEESPFKEIQEEPSHRSLNRYMSKKKKKQFEYTERFEDSKIDKTIVEGSMVPKIRYALDSLKKKDRFKVDSKD